MANDFNYGTFYAGYNLSPGQGNPGQGPSEARSLLEWLRDTAGGYPGPDLSQKTAVGDRIEAEKSRAGPPILRFPWFLPYIDDLTGETGTIRAEYRRMLREPNVKAALLDKLFSVAALDLQVVPDGEGPKAKRVAEFVKWNLTHRIKGGVRKMVESLGFGGMIDGYSVSEKVFQVEHKSSDWSGKWIVRALKAKDAVNDVILQTDQFRNIVGVQGLRYNAGLTFSPANFVIMSFLSLFEIPVGMSDLRAVYRAAWMLDTVMKLRAIGIEKRAWPYIIANYGNPQQKISLEATLQQAKLTSWMAVPPDVKVQALDVAGRSQDEFANFTKDLKHEVFMGLAGAILQATEGNLTGSRAMGKVHKDTASLFKWYLSTCVTDALNDEECGLVPDLVDLNFSGAGYPLVRLSSVDAEQTTTEIENAKGLHDIGLDLSKKELYDRTGWSPPEDDVDRLKGAPPKPESQGLGSGTQLNEFMDQNLFTGNGHANGLANGNGNGVMRRLPAPEGGARPFRGFTERWREHIKQRRASG